MNPIAKLLSDELLKRQQRNQKYSLRGFARALSLEPSVVSKLMRGQRIPGPKTLQKILQSLEVSEKEQMQIRSWLETVKSIGLETSLEQSQSAELEMVHFLVLEALRIKDFREFPERLRQELLLEKNVFQKILFDLMEQRLIWIDSESGKLKISSSRVRSSLNGPKTSDKFRTEIQYLKAAFQSLLNGIGESYSMTMAFPLKDVEAVKKRLLQAAGELRDESQERIQNADSVFNLTFTFYPALSKSK